MRLQGERAFNSTAHCTRGILWSAFATCCDRLREVELICAIPYPIPVTELNVCKSTASQLIKTQPQMQKIIRVETPCPRECISVRPNHTLEEAQVKCSPRAFLYPTK